ncbi:MAG: MotA/TolQ/ExbB proton channel family protein [Phycisphaerales bacterium]|nr:MotA/TolQ/ExbB proton channel family protein [Phycisphaerales bacterium]
MSEFFLLGGICMWPLAACSVALLALLIERAVVVVGPRWRSVSSERTFHRSFIPLFIEVAPALGLLGTMQGIIECFGVLGGSGSAKGALSGLGVACITTVYGLVIALVASLAGFTLDALGRVEVEPS